jgi:hypothetical protein
MKDGVNGAWEGAKSIRAGFLKKKPQVTFEKLDFTIMIHLGFSTQFPLKDKVFLFPLNFVTKRLYRAFLPTSWG